MNGLEKSINKLINMLVQYKTTIKKSTPSVLVGEASTFKAKGNRLDAGRKVRQRPKLSSQLKTLIVLLLFQRKLARERGRLVLSNSQGQTISAPITVRKGIGRRIIPNSLPSKVLKRSKKLKTRWSYNLVMARTLLLKL
ncbi:UNVERIFIED_CONTAM: hypothetical protein Slati_2408700 [Sesamum latifolium]|uniref:Uncharacterized protein n=1 Tax=Sesamum latifolium TaxID=2727402 RepID=A0AAW2WBP6_9LAMI